MSSEDTFRYNGPLSTYTEWDSFLYGIVVGTALSIDRVRRDLQREPSKAIAGALLAFVAIKLRAHDS